MNIEVSITERDLLKKVLDSYLSEAESRDPRDERRQVVPPWGRGPHKRAPQKSILTMSPRSL